MKRLSNLAVQFGRSCQSPRTGFVHLFMDQSGGDTIPVYENFCFALALIKQKSAEGVSEGKDLFQRLYAFQTPDSTLWKGNFPVYLHDFPRCWNPLQALRIAPLLKMLLRDFSHVLDSEFKDKTKAAIEQMLLYAEHQRARRPFLPLWERRYQALTCISHQDVASGCRKVRADQYCRNIDDEQFLRDAAADCSNFPRFGAERSFAIPSGETPFSLRAESSEEWVEELITAELLGASTEEFAQLIHPALGIYSGPSAQEPQERFEPKPTLLEWWAGSERYNQPHPLQLQLAALPDCHVLEHSLWSGEVSGWTVRQSESYALSYSNACDGHAEKTILRCLWSGSKLHTLSISTGSGSAHIEEMESGAKPVFDLPEEFDVSRNDLVELSAYVNISPETEIFINGQKGTVFALGDQIEIRTPRLSATLSFELIDGSGDFCGHLSRSNRPLQNACKGAHLYDAFDWKIALRTLRRSSKALLSLALVINDRVDNSCL